MDTSELLAVGKLLGYNVVAKPNPFERGTWTTYIKYEGQQAMIIISSSAMTEDSAMERGWDWVIEELNKGERYGI
tara:strand:+ start:4443 stop:4667 length:225 start_codon:yes stop_codon:yes gene_type:complete